MRGPVAQVRDDYRGRRVVVGGAGVAGAASAAGLLAIGAEVTVVDRSPSDRLDELAGRGCKVVVADGVEGIADGLFDGVTDLVVSPGFRPGHPLVAAAAEAGIDVYCEPELAWRLRGPNPAPWLAITGTNGKTTTVTMLEAILAAAGHRTAALGNIGEPLVTAVLEEDRYDVLAVELSSFQLHWSRLLAPEFGALLNLADDHLEWHGTMRAYTTAKTAVWRSADDDEGIAVGNLDDALTAVAFRRVSGHRVGVTLEPPVPGQLGVRDGVLVDCAFPGPDDAGVELLGADTIRPPGPHNVSNALAAAALARGFGVPAEAVRDGLAGYTPQAHRNQLVTTVAGVRYVDDSKATNPHAAQASLLAYPRVVWIAGGQLKGVAVDDLVSCVAGRLAGAVLLGVDRGQLAAALARHAPEVPVIEVSRTDDVAMGEAVNAAAGLARSGDTVLLAPAAASLDMFSSYAHRGRQFAAEVAKLDDAPPEQR